MPPFFEYMETLEVDFPLTQHRQPVRPIHSDHPFLLQVGGADLVRSAGNNLLGGEDAVLDEPANAMRRDAQRRGGFGHGQPLAVPVRRTGRHLDAVHRAQQTDAAHGPGLSLAGAHSHPVQRRGVSSSGQPARHAPHHGHGFLRRAIAVVAGSWLPDPQLRVLAARRWIVGTTSRAASSTSAMMSAIRARRSLWRRAC